MSSRGRGNRRSPGREGGRGRRRSISVTAQARHAVPSLEQLTAPVSFHCVYPGQPEEFTYRLDQSLERVAVPYHIALATTKDGHRVLTVSASARDEAKLQTAIAQCGGTAWPV